MAARRVGTSIKALATAARVVAFARWSTFLATLTLILCSTVVNSIVFVVLWIPQSGAAVAAVVVVVVSLFPRNHIFDFIRSVKDLNQIQRIFSVHLWSPLWITTLVVVVGGGGHLGLWWTDRSVPDGLRRTKKKCNHNHCQLRFAPTLALPNVLLSLCASPTPVPSLENDTGVRMDALGRGCDRSTVYRCCL